MGAETEGADMTPTAERIAEEALRLSHDEKAELVDRLVASLGTAGGDEADRAWSSADDPDFRAALERTNCRYAEALKKLAE